MLIECLAYGVGYNGVEIYQFYFMESNDAPSAIKYKLNRNETSSLQGLFDRSDLGDYFQRISSSTASNLVLSSYFAGIVLQGVDLQLQEGRLNIADKSQDFEKLIDEPIIKEQEQKLLQMKAKKAFIEKQLQSLKIQTSIHKDSEDGDTSGIVLSRNEHKSLVQRIKKQRQERERRHQEMLLSMQEKSKQKQQMQQKQRQQKQKTELKQRREQIQRSLLKHKQKHEQFLQIERQSRQKMKAMSAQKFKYQQIQQNYQKQVVLYNLQEKKRKLKQIRKYKVLNLEELKQHERNYLEQKKLTQSRHSIKQDWNYQPPQRSQKLTQILEEQRFQRIRKQQEKKKRLEENLTRHEDYVNYLKENFVPKIDPLKKEQIEKRLQRQNKERPEVADLKEIGLLYLEQAKKKRKKIEKSEPRAQSERNQTNPINLTNMSIGSVGESKARAMTNYLSIDHDGQHFQKRRRKNLQKLIHSEQMNQADKIKQLKLEAGKIEQNMQRKQRQLKYKKDRKLKDDALQLLLSSIQAKIGIIEMYQ